MRARTIMRWSGLAMCLLLACCERQPHQNGSRDAFRHFDPPPPGVANRPLLNTRGEY